MAGTNNANTLDNYTFDKLIKEVLQVTKTNFKVPGRFSEGEVENFYRNILLIEELCKQIGGSFIDDSYYHSISWSKKSYKDIGCNGNESYHYYRSPHFSICYNSKRGFNVNRLDSLQELRKDESEIYNLLNQNIYVYYAVTVFVKTIEDSLNFKKIIKEKLSVRLSERTSSSGVFIDVIPYQISELSDKLKTISETIKIGFYLGGQRDATQIKLEEDYTGELKYLKMV